MKIPFKTIQWNRIQLSHIYIISLVGTMIFLLAKKSEILIQTSLFDKASLVRLEEQIQSSKQFFLYLLKERVAVILALFVFSTTTLGTMYVHMCSFWYGACSGLFLTLVLLRYGLKGLLLLFAGIFPHYLIYVPMMVLTMRLTREKRCVNGKFCMQIVVILVVVIIGCLLECYVNPSVVSKMLKKF